MRAAELSLQKYNYLLYFQIVLQVHIRRLHPDFFLFTCLLLPRAPSLLLDASLRSNNKRLLMRIQSSFADFHSFNKPISSPCAPLTQRNYGNMTDNNAIVISMTILAGSLPMFYGWLRLHLWKNIYFCFCGLWPKACLRSISGPRAQSPLKVSDYALFLHLSLWILWLGIKNVVDKTVLFFCCSKVVRLMHAVLAWGTRLNIQPLKGIRNILILFSLLIFFRPEEKDQVLRHKKSK